MSVQMSGYSGTQWAWLATSVIVAVFTIIMAAGSWSELNTPVQVGAMVVNAATVAMNFFKQKIDG